MPLSRCLWRTAEVVAFAAFNPASVQWFEAWLRLVAQCVVRRAVGTFGANVFILLAYVLRGFLHRNRRCGENLVEPLNLHYSKTEMPANIPASMCVVSSGSNDFVVANRSNEARGVAAPAQVKLARNGENLYQQGLSSGRRITRV
jgi:hypothetical protein